MAAVTTMQTATVSARITTVSHSILMDVTDNEENTDSLDTTENTDIVDNDTESDNATTEFTALSNTAQLAKAERGESHTGYKNRV